MDLNSTDKGINVGYWYAPYIAHGLLSCLVFSLDEAFISTSGNRARKFAGQGIAAENNRE